MAKIANILLLLSVLIFISVMFTACDLTWYKCRVVKVENGVEHKECKEFSTFKEAKEFK